MRKLIYQVSMDLYMKYWSIFKCNNIVIGLEIIHVWSCIWQFSNQLFWDAKIKSLIWELVIYVSMSLAIFESPLIRFVFNHRNLFSNKELIGKYKLFFYRKSKLISQKTILLEEADFLRFLKFLHKQRQWKNLTKSWKKDPYRLLTRVPRLSAMYLKIS